MAKDKKLREEAKALHGGAHNAYISKEFMVDHDRFNCALIVAPEDVESYICTNILNYNGFPMSVDEDNVVRQIIKKEMGFDMEQPYPCLVIDSASPVIPSADIAGNQNILKFLQQEGFIRPYMSHSAKESQTLEDFIDPIVSPYLQNMLRSSLKTRMQFYSVPRHFKQFKYDREVRFVGFMYLWKIYKSMWHVFEEKVGRVEAE